MVDMESGCARVEGKILTSKRVDGLDTITTTFDVSLRLAN
jgi:hypothetical protein